MQASGMEEVTENSPSVSQRELKVSKDLPTFNTSKLESARYTTESRKRNTTCQREAENPVWEKKIYIKQKKIFLTSSECLFYGRL